MQHFVKMLAETKLTRATTTFSSCCLTAWARAKQTKNASQPPLALLEDKTTGENVGGETSESSTRRRLKYLTDPPPPPPKKPQQPSKSFFLLEYAPTHNKKVRAWDPASGPTPGPSAHTKKTKPTRLAPRSDPFPPPAPPSPPFPPPPPPHVPPRPPVPPEKAAKTLKILFLLGSTTRRELFWSELLGDGSRRFWASALRARTCADPGFISFGNQRHKRGPWKTSRKRARIGFRAFGNHNGIQRNKNRHASEPRVANFSWQVGHCMG